MNLTYAKGRKRQAGCYGEKGACIFRKVQEQRLTALQKLSDPSSIKVCSTYIYERSIYIYHPSHQSSSRLMYIIPKPKRHNPAATQVPPCTYPKASPNSPPRNLPAQLSVGKEQYNRVAALETHRKPQFHITSMCPTPNKKRRRSEQIERPAREGEGKEKDKKR